MASKKNSVPAKLSGGISCSLCAGIGKSRTTNQSYIYILVVEDEERMETDWNDEGREER